MYVNKLITMQENASTYSDSGRGLVGHVTLSSPGRIMCYVQNLKQQNLGDVYCLYVFNKAKNRGLRVGPLKQGRESRWLVNERDINESGISLNEIDGVAIVAEKNLQNTEMIMSGFTENRYMIIPIIDELFNKTKSKKNNTGVKAEKAPMKKSYEPLKINTPIPPECIPMEPGPVIGYDVKEQSKPQNKLPEQQQVKKDADELVDAYYKKEENKLVEQQAKENDDKLVETSDNEEENKSLEQPIKEVTEKSINIADNQEENKHQQQTKQDADEVVDAYYNKDENKLSGQSVGASWCEKSIAKIMRPDGERIQEQPDITPAQSEVDVADMYQTPNTVNAQDVAKAPNTVNTQGVVQTPNAANAQDVVQTPSAVNTQSVVQTSNAVNAQDMSETSENQIEPELMGVNDTLEPQNEQEDTEPQGDTFEAGMANKVKILEEDLGSEPEGVALEDINVELVKIIEKLKEPEKPSALQKNVDSGIPYASTGVPDTSVVRGLEDQVLKAIIAKLKEDKRVLEKTRNIEQQIQKMQHLPKEDKKSEETCNTSREAEQTSVSQTSTNQTSTSQTFTSHMHTLRGIDLEALEKDDEENIFDSSPRKAHEYLKQETESLYKIIGSNEIEKDSQPLEDQKEEVDYINAIDERIKEIESKRNNTPCNGEH